MAVSGGPDSVALLLLANAARGGIAAATVDHQLRAGSAEEVAQVGALCVRIGVPHTTLAAVVAPGASVQAKAREARYAALGRWAEESGIDYVLTAHHLDDQAETLLMRLARGAGLSGLAGVRASRALSDRVMVARPLLGWRKAELEAIVREAGLTAVDDPSNRDPAHDRTRIRAVLGETGWLDPARVAATARHLAESEEALGWATDALASERIAASGDSLSVDAAGLPRELQRRLVIAAMVRLRALPPRGRDLDHVLRMLAIGEPATLGGLKFKPGARWRIAPAPPRSA